MTKMDRAKAELLHRLLVAVDRLLQFDGPASFLEKASSPYADWGILRDARNLYASGPAQDGGFHAARALDSIVGESEPRHQLESDFRLISQVSKDHPAWLSFQKEMDGKQYGREPLNQAWAFFAAGYDAALEGSTPIFACPLPHQQPDEPFDDAIRILRSRLNETKTMRETLTSAQEAGTRLHNALVKTKNELRTAHALIKALGARSTLAVPQVASRPAGARGKVNKKRKRK